MYAFHVKAYSHHFVVSGYNDNGHRVVKEYARRFVAVEVTRNWDGSYTRTPTEVYAARSQDQREYRFHINDLENFIQCINNNGYPTSSIQFETVPMYPPVPVEMKLLPGVVLRSFQEPIVDHLCKPIISKLVELQTGQGKAQPLDAAIKVPGGWKSMGDMQVGDELIAKDGSITTVIGVFPQGEKEIFKVTFADGRSTECCKEHLWKVYRPNRSWDSKIVNTEEMIRLKSLSNNRLYIDLPDPELGKDLDLPLDPYVLGVLLGDASIAENALTISTPDSHILQRLKLVLPDTMEIRHASKYDYRLMSPVWKGNVWLDTLRDMGLTGTVSQTKFVPPRYLLGSLHQRLELIRGLMDTDGTVQKDGGSLSYCTTSVELASAMQYLIRSVGGMATVRSRTPFYTYKGEKKFGQVAYEVDIRHKRPTELLSLPRKKELTYDDGQYNATLKLSVVSIEPVGRKEAQCISIAHPERLYVTDEFVVTHNTMSTLAALVRIGHRAVVAIKGMYVARWLEDLTDEKKKKVDLNPEDVLVVRGANQLIKLIAAGLRGKIKAKVIIITSKTLYAFYKHYRESGGDTEVYGIAPYRLYEAIGAGVRVIDEVHQEFHFNFMQDLYSHVPTTINLSATFRSDNQFLNGIYKIMFPPWSRAEVPDLIKYVAVYGVTYTLRNRDKVKYLQRGKGYYSHVVFEESIMKDSTMLSNYLKLIDEALAAYFLDMWKPGLKALVFAATVQMCRLIRDYLQKSFNFNDMTINKYTGEDEYEKLLTADVVISTIGSAGTAVDIPNLIAVVSSTAVSKAETSIQNMGRIRELKEHPDIIPRFVYLICTDIPKHVEYHHKKQRTFKGRALSHDTLAARTAV